MGVLIAVAKADFEQVYGESTRHVGAFPRRYLPDPATCHTGEATDGQEYPRSDRISVPHPYYLTFPFRSIVTRTSFRSSSSTPPQPSGHQTSCTDAPPPPEPLYPAPHAARRKSHQPRPPNQSPHYGTSPGPVHPFRPTTAPIPPTTNTSITYPC